jgi:hypothetical protein
MPVAAFTLDYHNGVTWQTIPAGSVLSISGAAALDDAPSGIAFGSDTDVTLRGELLLSLWASLPHMTPIRYTTQMDATSAYQFNGFLTRRTRDLERMTFEASGPKVKIAATKGYSPMIERRPLATLTSAASIEDPTNANYLGGLINWLWWQSGGRPLQQAASYPSALFYYSVDGTALLAPEFAWAAGEDGWAECVEAAKRSGGQVMQDGAGVVRYKQILGYGGLTATETLDEGSYASLEEDEEPGPTYGTTYLCPYLPRRRLGRQEVINDDTPRLIAPGETISVILEPEQPLVALETASSTQLKASSLIITKLDGTPSSSYTHTLDVKAARITIGLTNTGAQPLMLWRIRLNGDPVVAGEAGSIAVGSGTVERTLESSPYIQNEDDAQRYAQMTKDFYSTQRSRIVVRGCVHNPGRQIGQSINLTNAQWGLSAVKHVILGIEHSETGVQDDLTVAPVADLPTQSGYYLIGGSYTSSSNLKLGW